ncbi:MAG: hypothetical protein H0U62_04355 [Actinobacteria bacterium]|nr:hypothetical protein [Actinomycetota bacterium]
MPRRGAGRRGVDQLDGVGEHEGGQGLALLPGGLFCVLGDDTGRGADHGLGGRGQQ